MTFVCAAGDPQSTKNPPRLHDLLLCLPHHSSSPHHPQGSHKHPPSSRDFGILDPLRLFGHTAIEFWNDGSPARTLGGMKLHTSVDTCGVLVSLEPSTEGDAHDIKGRKGYKAETQGLSVKQPACQVCMFASLQTVNLQTCKPGTQHAHAASLIFLNHTSASRRAEIEIPSMISRSPGIIPSLKAVAYLGEV